MKIIDFCKHKISGFSAFFQVIKTNRMVAVAIAGLIFILSTVASGLIGKATSYFIPSLDDSAAIIENQNKQFDLVKENLNKLQSSISGKDREYLDAAFDTIKNIKNDGDNLALKLAALQDENISLKTTLKSSKGIYGGIDIILPDNAGFKIDSQTAFGYGHTYPGGPVKVSLTSANEGESVKGVVLSSGEGVKFTNENNKKCLLVYSGSTQVTGSKQAGNFVISCKK